MLAEDTAMAVIGVLAEAFVGYQERVLEDGTQGAQRLLDDAVVLPGARPLRILGSGYAKEDERADAEIHGGGDLLDQAIDAELIIARHRYDFVFDIFAGTDEQRQNEVMHGK